MLERLLSWAEQHPAVRTAILIGSRATSEGAAADRWADWDLSLFGGPWDLIEQDQWLAPLGIWKVCVRDGFAFAGEQIPTRLVLFSEGEKVDFSFHPQKILLDMTQSGVLPPAYDGGYRVLVDKDGLAAALPPASHRGFVLDWPSSEEFACCQQEFFFESYHVAKYLSRKELWAARNRDYFQKNWLLKMLQWESRIQKPTDVPFKPEAKNASQWLLPLQVLRLRDCFAGSDAAGQWKALDNTLECFEASARFVAAHQGYVFLEETSRWLDEFLKKIKPPTDERR